jgi:uncharacterized protein YjbI with pentapeptide repeats
MAKKHDFERWREIRKVHQHYGDFYRGLAGVSAAVLLILLGILIGRSDDEAQIRAFDLNMATELIGVVIVLALFALINYWQAERRYKRKLADEAASPDNAIAKHAVFMMQRRGWLHGDAGLLRRGKLQFANLQGANLKKANLAHANFEDAILRDAVTQAADLRDANFVFTDMRGMRSANANLEKALFIYSNLEGAGLHSVNLNKTHFNICNCEGASFFGAQLKYTLLESSNLVDADFENADLQITSFQNSFLLGANFDGAIFSELTVLPDSTYWTPETDMRRFTDASHPDFWVTDLSPFWVGGVLA